MRVNDDDADPSGESARARNRTDGGHALPHGQLTDAVIGAMFRVHSALGAGFLESVYANALALEVRRRGIAVERNVPFQVLYDGVVVGRYVADLVVDRRVVVETKVAKAIDAAHRAQVRNYLRASGLEVGLVLNFGTSAQFKRVVCTSGFSARAEAGNNDDAAITNSSSGNNNNNNNNNNKT
jgi:GxxExxY protein